jgi:hypothetical protein
MPRPYNANLAGFIVAAFANSGVIITDSLTIVLGAGILMAGRPALKAQRVGHDH